MEESGLENIIIIVEFNELWVDHCGGGCQTEHYSLTVMHSIGI